VRNHDDRGRRDAVRPVDDTHPDEHDPLADGVHREPPEEAPLEDVTPADRGTGAGGDQAEGHDNT
jgi:hypothetical protein